MKDYGRQPHRKTQKKKLNIPEYLSQLPDRQLYKQTLDSFAIPEQVQELVLKQIIEISGNTEFGRKHHFQLIKTIEDYRKLVPISEWADYDAYSDRMAEGEPDILFPGNPEFFLKTSGTTSAKPKLIPESKLGAAAKHIVTRLRLVEMALNFPGILESGYIIPLPNSSAQSKTSSGIPVGFASGFTLNQSMEGGQAARIAFPVAVLSNGDSESRDYLIMRFAMQHPDVVGIFGNNAGRIKELVEFAANHADEIINDIEIGTVSGAKSIDSAVMKKIEVLLTPDQSRADELRLFKKQTGTLLPKDYWPSMQMLAFWLSSSVGQYIKEVRPIMPASAKFFDVGYGSSEAKFNIPSKPDNASGALSLFTAFYEFIPEKGGDPLLVHQLEDGKMYELIITTWSGLFRYNMKDMVKVQGYTGSTPNIVFLYKSGDILNITDEKIPASVVNEIIREIAETMGVNVVQVQIFADEEERRYICYIEPKEELNTEDATLLEQRVHEKMLSTIFTYEFFHVQQKLLNALKIVVMKKGWKDDLDAQRISAGLSLTQIKLPVIFRQKADNEWIK